MAVKREERIASGIMTIFSAAYLVGTFFLIPKSSLRQVVGPDVFPKAVGGLMLLISVIYLIQQLRGYAKEVDDKRAAIIGADEKVETKADIKTMGIMVLIMIAYALLFEPLGYAVTTFLSFMAGVFVLNRKHILRDTIIGFIASFGMYFIFTLLLRVQLPAGLLSLLGL
ncbi:MAG: tripartite tricarboxylate transporter TctB family protein [Rectinemataceae bacterium]